jgi:hypothetical protein
MAIKKYMAIIFLTGGTTVWKKKQWCFLLSAHRKLMKYELKGENIFAFHFFVNENQNIPVR